MHPDEMPLLAAVRAAPADDLPRLVYADWLDEHARRGSAFIRAECALAAMPLNSPRWHAAFVRYRRASEGLPEPWCRAISRHSQAHWLAASARSAWARL